MKKLNLLLILLFAGFSNIFAQSVTLEKGKEFEIEAHTVTNTADNQNDYKYTFWFKAGDRDGVNTIFDCKLVKVVYAEKFTRYSFANSILNTDTVRGFRLNTTTSLLPLALLHQPLKVTIGPHGEFLSVTGFDEAIQDAITRWMLKDDIANQLKDNSKYFPKDVIGSLFLPLPQQRIAYKSEWSSPNTRYKVTAINGALLYITTTGIKVPDSQGDDVSGNIVFNEVTGLTEQLQNSSPSKIEIAIDGKKQLLPVFYRRQTVRYGAEKHLPDTAWINMVVKTHTAFGKAFKSGTEMDSVKVQRYLKAHDDAFANDEYYAVIKLRLLQGSGDYIKYSHQLMKTPTRFIKDEESHLFNKFNSILDSSAQSAYEVARYMYKQPGFNGLIQQSYAQSFLTFDIDDMLKDDGFRKNMQEKNMSDEDARKMIAEENKKRLAGNSTARQLLELLHNDKDPLMQQKINALYLWEKANSADDAGVLNKTASAFMNMDDAYMKQGNGGRYALLVYKLLINAKKETAAKALLVKTIQNLERYTADTLNTNRFADQNILAYAYYLQYTRAKLTDSVKALQYLSKAAQYSPYNSKEKAYASFYDRVFLHSKEGYRDEFIERLFNNGDEQQALAIFADHINAEPVSLDEMQKIYQQHIPGKSFADFFKAKVLDSWQAAPVFTLKGLDGKDYALADFKNKWLVLDFWGTWCAPCRGEMPDINTFNQEINDGKHNGITFMSIACRDNETNVKAYFEASKFNLPAAMADANIEKLYGISSYPSKVIISPDGKMLPLKFGDDWRAIVQRFNEVVPAN
ncbi:TlpA family protein disulfide reductase [Mucilaginibacter kameinonensis]|uniref:TlpA family protein disulfide reductase n=1 Tax=Mucilaginibacter kameinonensis TaxID=452286 RepID=UPI000EF7D664|nr:TlpA disulfide reductase family protein [Mucilaginibacter kameinonensis]